MAIKINAIFYEIQLELSFKEKGEFAFKWVTNTVKTHPQHKPRFLNLPFWMLPEIRSIFAKWLIEKDGSYQQIGAAPRISQQLFERLMSTWAGHPILKKELGIKSQRQIKQKYCCESGLIELMVWP